VLSLQNGVENADRLCALLPQEVIGAAVYVGVEMAGPGHVRHHGRGELVIERSKASDDVARALIAAGVPTDISDNVRGALWAKLITNCAYNALSAISQLPYDRLVQGEGVTVVRCTARPHAGTAGRAGPGTSRGLRRGVRPAERPLCRGVHTTCERRDVQARARLGHRMDARGGDERSVGSSATCSEEMLAERRASVRGTVGTCGPDGCRWRSQ
jgi:hypothetical protein